MSTIQNLKNFIRHGKQARASNPPRGDATTTVSPVHAHQQRHEGQLQNIPGLSEPPPAGYYAHQAPAAAQQPVGGYSAAPVDNRNVAAQAGGVAARVAGEGQKLQYVQQHQHQHQQQVPPSSERKKEYDPAVLERIVAEERESKGKLPRYPGLDRYRLLEKMGDGAFSNVYRAKDLAGEFDEVAVKVVRKFELNNSQGDKHLHPDFKKQPKVVERANILKEVQIMRKLDHPNIVKLVSFSESSQYYFIVLELCPGGELFHQIVRLTYFSEDLSRHVIVQVAKALEYIHEEQGVVHRDIKPENLLFYPIPFIPTKNPKPKGPEDEEKADEGEFVPGLGSGGIGQIKIADFGLSKVVWESQTMTPCGTVGYTAPEIVKDERYSKSVDMWALGCVLYTLLCGFPPFYDESIPVLTEKVARGQYTFLSPWWDDISKGAQDLVSHLLTVDPDKRYTIHEFLKHPWIRQTNEATFAAADAPPLATPMHMRQGNAFDSTPGGLSAGGLAPTSDNPAWSQLLETPGGGMRRMDFRSPGAVNLREVFDVGYAVRRQEEEGKRRKNFKQGYRGAGGVTGLNALDEAEDDYEDDETAANGLVAGGAGAGGAATGPGGVAGAMGGGYGKGGVDPPAKLPKPDYNGMAVADVSGVEQKMRNANLGNNASAAAQARAAAAGVAVPPPAKQQQHQQPQQRGYGQHSPAVAAAAKQQVRMNNKGTFELSLDNATLLGRRGKGQESKLRQQIVQ